MRFTLGYNRTHGAVALLRQRAESARCAAREADSNGESTSASNCSPRLARKHLDETPHKYNTTD